MYLQFLRIWWFGDALGTMIVTPLFLGAWTHTRNVPRHFQSIRLPDIAVASRRAGRRRPAARCPSRDADGHPRRPGSALAFCDLCGRAVGPVGAAVTVAALSILILVLTTQGRNPFGADAPRDAVIHAQEFIFVLSVMTLGLATLVSHVQPSQQSTRARLNEEFGAAPQP